MTNEYELADNSRTKLIYEKEDLLAPIQPGMVQPPHSMIDDFVAQDYYDGKVTGASAEQFAEVELIKQKNQGI
jgi:NADH-quinone oxidoreductase subunit I